MTNSLEDQRETLGQFPFDEITVEDLRPLPYMPGSAYTDVFIGWF